MHESTSDQEHRPWAHWTGATAIMRWTPPVILLGMKAVVYARYGPPEVLRLDEIERPRPRRGQVLIKVRTVSVNASDWETLRPKPLYARIGGPVRPRDLGIRPRRAGRGNRGPGRHAVRHGVFGDNLALMGGFAEYLCAREQTLAAKPAGLSFEEAAAIPQAGVIALQGIQRQGRVQPGQKVLVNGAGAGAGMFAGQLAKLAGAQVTGVDNAGKIDFVRSLGAGSCPPSARPCPQAKPCPKATQRPG